MKVIVISYILPLVVLVVYSYGFVDPNLVLSNSPLYLKIKQPLLDLVFHNRPLSTIVYIFIILLFTIYYLLFTWFAKRKRLTLRQLRWLIGITVGILLVSYPAFSHDIFNYIFTAKVAYFYRENPYIVMPIEFIGDPNLAFTRAANKISLYGPSWILLTLFPHFLSFHSIVSAIFTFKLLITAFYVGTLFLIWRISKSIYSLSLFALNPLVLIETIVSGHNDIVMMFFALLAFYLMQKNSHKLAFLALILSILIKYATIVLLPLFFYVAYIRRQKKKVDWEKVYAIAVVVMFVPFLAAPLREEIYPWYVIWLLAFVVLIPKKTYLLSLVVALSFSSLLRYLPVLYTGSYFGTTPIVKELFTFVPLVAFTIFWLWKNMLWQKYFR